ncbi:MAG: heme A synthase [Deltaproteobacteria bacterium]|nr:heme A synthase [Deltaproteobacteria bacterium]MBW2395543.1 heme A synthase [Deltaproteobacteria bacterium]
MESTGLPASTSTLRRLGLAFALLLTATYCLIVLGALVRANGAGLACPDWPLCFGQVVPEFDLKIAFEWGHRTIAGIISSVFLMLSILALRNKEARAVVRRLIPLAAAVLVLQIILGAITVWKLLAVWSVTLHLLAGNAFAVLLLLLVRALLEAAEPTPREWLARSSSACVLTSATFGLLIVQVGLGGMVSSLYAGMACPEWPMCFQGRFVPTFFGPQGVHVLHRLSAYALIPLLAICAWRTRGIPRLAFWHAAALLIGIAQVVVGIANVLLRLPAEVTGLHSALAASLVLALAMATRETWRGLGARRAAAGGAKRASETSASWVSANWASAPECSRISPDRGQ